MQWAKRHWKGIVASLTIACSVIAFGIRFRDYVVCRVAEYALRSADSFPDDLRVSCTSSLLTLRDFSCKNLAISAKSDPDFSIHAATCQVTFFSRTAGFYPKPHIHLGDVSFHLPASAKEGEKKGIGIKQVRRLYRLGSLLTIHRGVVHLDSASYIFTFDEEKGKRALRLFQDADDTEPNCTVYLAKSQHEYMLQLTANTLDLAPLATLPIASAHSFYLKKGIAEGELKLSLTKDALCKNLVYSCSIHGFEAAFENYTVGAHQVSIEKKTPDGRFFPVDAAWTIEGGYLSCEDEMKKRHHLLQNVAFDLSERQDGEFTLSGTLKHWGGVHPIHGKGYRKRYRKGSSLSMNFSSGPMKLLGRLTSNEDTLQVRGELQECDVHLVDILLRPRFARHLATLINQPEVYSGVISGSMCASIKDWSVASLEVEEVTLEKFNLDTGTPVGTIFGDELQCFFRYAAGEVPSWGVHAKNISLPHLNIDTCSGDFAIHERYVIPSTIEASVENVALKATLRGVLPHLKVSLHAQGGWGQACSTFFPGHTFSPHELSVLKEIAFQFGLHIEEGTFSFQGAASLLAHAHHEEVSFSGRVKKPWLSSGTSVHEIIEDLSFNSRGMSSVLLNLPLGISGQQWRLKGTSGCFGEVTQEAVKLTFASPKISFESPVLQISPKALQKDACIQYDFEKAAWEGEFSVEESDLLLQKIGLKLENSSGIIHIAEREISLRSVLAHYGDLRVGGRMVVHFPDKDDVRLEMITTELDGTVESLQALLSHFEGVQAQGFPFTGRVTQEEGKGLRLKASFHESEPILHWGADLRVYQAEGSLGKEIAFSNCAFDIEWNGVADEVVFSHISAQLLGLTQYEMLVCKDCSFSMKQGVIDAFSLLIENETHSIVSAKGHIEKHDDSYSMVIDEKDAHVFSIPIEKLHCSFDETFSLRSLSFAEKCSVPQAQLLVQAINAVSPFPFLDALSQIATDFEVKSEPHIELMIDTSKKCLSVSARSAESSLKGRPYGHWAASFEMKEDKITHCHFESPEITLDGVGDLKKERVRFDVLELRKGRAYGKLNAVTFHLPEKKMSCAIDKMYVKLEDLLPLIPQLPQEYAEFITGAATCTGELTVDFSKEGAKPRIFGSVDVIAPKFGKGNLQLVSQKPLSFVYTPDGKLSLSSIEIALSTLNNSDHWAQIECADLVVDTQTKDWNATELRMLVPPEMMLFIAETESVPNMKADARSITLYGLELPWENQVDITTSIGYNAGVFSCAGKIKDGYYWVGNTSLFIHDVSFQLGKDRAVFSAQLDAYKQPVQVTIEGLFSPGISAQVKIEDMRPPQDRLNDSRTSCVIFLAEDARGKVNIKSIQGGIYGIDISFQQQSHRTNEKELVLSGKVKCHMPYLATILPHHMQSVVETLGMGKGYEVSGDITLDWEDLHASTFAGYIKGKNFELLNARIQTLMGTLRITKDEVSVDRFTISDEAGQLTINEIQCLKGDDKIWRLTIPQIALQDFRPSLLRYIGKFRGKIKPLVIRELSFQDITGELQDPASFTGIGDMHFTNTFKKEYNLLDIPFELIARLGIDMGLLVPIRGKLSYEIRDGRIYFTELSESCSEGKRSKFYLSKSSPSYIGLDGEVNVSIKMKQYVILKVTEPFILSISGTLKKPKYSLR